MLQFTEFVCDIKGKIQLAATVVEPGAMLTSFVKNLLTKKNDPLHPAERALTFD